MVDPIASSNYVIQLVYYNKINRKPLLTKTLLINSRELTQSCNKEDDIIDKDKCGAKTYLSECHPDTSSVIAPTVFGMT